MSLAELWRKQQLEIEKNQEANKPFKENFKRLGEEKEIILGKEKLLNEQKQDLLQLKETAKKAEDHLAELESQRNKITKELYGGTVKNPKELSILEEQGKNLDKQIHKLLELYFELEEKGVSVEKSILMGNETLNAEKNQYNQRVRILKKDWEISKAKIEGLNEEIQTIEAHLSPQLLAKYQRLQTRLGSNVVAEVRKGICGACGIQLSSLLHQQLRLGEQVQCENCGRLLLAGEKVPNKDR